jgi:KaiC/GvpD/RAD55 family RecA-like ATPase
MYIELVEKDIKNRGTIIPFDSMVRAIRPYECYTTMFPFDQSIVDHIKKHNSIKGHDGKHYCPYFIIDIDRENDLDQARLDTLGLIDYFRREYDLPPSDLLIYFSGSKGFHIAFTKAIYGEIEPTRDMGAAIRRAVVSICPGDFNIDTSIYENHRIIRTDNSINAKTGLYKIRLTASELSLMSIGQIKELAVCPREIPYVKPQRNELISRAVQAAFIKSEDNAPVDDGFFIMADVHRNEKLYKMGCVLFKASDLHEKSIYEILKSINASGSVPLDDKELRTIVKSARTARDAKGKEEDLKISTFAEMWDAWIDSLKFESDKIKMVFRSLDEEFQGKQRGRLGVILGYGGSKKSIYAQNMTYQNICSGRRVIYSNMEMGTAELTSRFINIACDGENKMAADDLAAMVYSGKSITSIFESIREIISTKLMVSENTAMTTDRYDKLIDKLTRESGPIDVLIVDGMSMMGGPGTEVEKASENSRQLKDLAKKWDILVLLIVHASKGEDLTTRDLTRKARASEKIVDNADWLMTMSLLKGDDNEYLPDWGVFHCWNKRGSGRRIEKAWNFEHNTLRMIESDRNLKMGGPVNGDF